MTIDTKIWIALISGITGLVTTIISSYRMYINNKKIEIFKTMLEQQKDFNLEYLKAFLDLEVEERKNNLNGFKNLINAVQIFKDKVRWIVTHPKSFAPRAGKKELDESLSAVQKSYAINQLHFTNSNNQDDRAIAHELKNVCTDLYENVLYSLSSKKSIEVQSHTDQINSISKLQDKLRCRAYQYNIGLINQIKEEIDLRHSHDV